MRLGVLRGVGGGEQQPSVIVSLPSPGDYLAIGDVDRQINVPEGARSDLPHQFVFPSDDKFGFRAAAARHPETRRWRRGRSPDTSGGEDGGLRVCSARYNCGERRASEKRGFVGVTGARSRLREAGSPPLAEGRFVKSGRGGWRSAGCFGAAAAVSRPRRRCGLGKGRGELGRRYRCHHCRRLRPGGTPSLRRCRHLVPPAPANTKCPQSLGAASSRRRALWERELGRSFGRVGCETEGGTGSARVAAHAPSVTPAPPSCACALRCPRTAQARYGLQSFPSPGSLPLPAVCGSTLATC